MSLKRSGSQILFVFPLMEHSSDFDLQEKISLSLFDSEAQTDNPWSPPELLTCSVSPQNVLELENPNFDYKSFIQKELSRLDAEALDPDVKKKLVQKIRNRVSAHRSRVRQKSSFTKLEQENKELRKMLSSSLDRIAKLESENKLLLAKLDTSFNSTEEESSERSHRVTRSSRNSTPVFPTLFIAILVVCLSTFFQNPSTPSSVVRLAGVIPSIAHTIVPPPSYIQTLENTCRGYCDLFSSQSCESSDEKALRISNKSVAVFEPRNPDAYSRFVCREAFSEDFDTVFIVKREEMYTDTKGVYLISNLSKLSLAA